MKKWVVTIVWALGLVVPVMGQKATMMVPMEEPKEEVVWISWEEAYERSMTDENPKKVFVDVYTDWCGWCKRMDATTFSDPKPMAYMRKKYYLVKLDAEQKADIVFKGNTFKYVASGRRGYHQLAAALLQGKLSYPTTVFLDEEFNIITPVPGFRKAPEFFKIARFVGEEEYKKGVRASRRQTGK